MNHLNSWYITIGGFWLQSTRVNFVVFIKNWKLCLGWEFMLREEGMLEPDKKEIYGYYVWMDSWDEISKWKELKEMLAQQATRSYWEVIKIKARGNDRPGETKAS